MKKSFSLLEIIVTISLITLLYTIFLPNNKIKYLDELVNRIELYISYTREKALIDDKYDLLDKLWHKKRWTIKFFRCQKSEGGIYYSIYSDKNKSGHVSIEDTLKDPLSGKNIYSSNGCEENNLHSKYVLLTKEFGIIDVQMSCNSTTSLGQLSFGSDGKIYSRLSEKENEENEYEITAPCSMKFIAKDGNSREIMLYPKTGYSKINENHTKTQ